MHRGPEATWRHQSHDPVQWSGRNETQHCSDGLASRLEAEWRPSVLEDLHQWVSDNRAQETSKHFRVTMLQRPLPFLQTLWEWPLQHTWLCWCPKTSPCSPATVSLALRGTLMYGGLSMTVGCLCCCPSFCDNIRYSVCALEQKKPLIKPLKQQKNPNIHIKVWIAFI